MARREKHCYCPFGCVEADAELGVESQFDGNGYCRHLVGFLNLEPGRKAAGRMFEPLEAIYYPVRDERGEPIIDERIVETIVDVEKTVKDERTKEEVVVTVPEARQVSRKVPRLVHSGLMRVSGKNRQPVLPTDVAVSPEQLQEVLTWRENRDGQEIVHRPRLGIPTRIYRKDGNAPVMLKPQDEDPGTDLRARIEDRLAEVAELQAEARALDLKRTPSDVDEIAVAEKATQTERRRMREDAFAGSK